MLNRMSNHSPVICLVHFSYGWCSALIPLNETHSVIISSLSIADFHKVIRLYDEIVEALILVVIVKIAGLTG